MHTDHLTALFEEMQNRRYAMRRAYDALDRAIASVRLPTEDDQSGSEFHHLSHRASVFADQAEMFRAAESAYFKAANQIPRRSRRGA